MLCECPDCGCPNELILERPPLDFKQHPEPQNPKWGVRVNTYNKSILNVCADCWTRHFGKEALVTSMQQLLFERQVICPSCGVERLGGDRVFVTGDESDDSSQVSRDYVQCNNCGMGHSYRGLRERIKLGDSVKISSAPNLESNNI